MSDKNDDRNRKYEFGAITRPATESRRRFDPVDLFCHGLPLKGHRAGKIDPAWREIYDRANRLDDWPSEKPKDTGDEA